MGQVEGSDCGQCGPRQAKPLGYFQSWGALSYPGVESEMQLRGLRDRPLLTSAGGGFVVS